MVPTALSAITTIGLTKDIAQASHLMTTYEQENFDQIATALGIEVGQIAKHASQFETAALWYRLDGRRPRRAAPSKVREKLDRVAKSARRLLKSMGVNDGDEAADCFGDHDILKALALVGDVNEDPVTAATRRIGRLQEIAEGVMAAVEFERRAKTASIEVAEVGELTVREGNSGDEAINGWVVAMMSLYRAITGKEPATSVGAPDRLNKGIAGGPLVRFLEAAGKPLGLEFSGDAWRSRVRPILEDASNKN
jgi:hypothetical protein